MVVSVSDSTYEHFKFLLRQDKGVTQSESNRILAFIRNGGEQKSEEPPADPEKLPLIIPRQRAAELLGRSPRTIDNLAKAGILEKVVFPERKESAGISRDSFLRMLGRMEPLKPENIKAKTDRFKANGHAKSKGKGKGAKV